MILIIAMQARAAAEGRASKAEKSLQAEVDKVSKAEDRANKAEDRASKAEKSLQAEVDKVSIYISVYTYDIHVFMMLCTAIT